MFLCAVVIFLFNSMYGSFCSGISESSLSKRIDTRKVESSINLIGYDKNQSQLKVLKSSTSNSIYSGTNSDVHQEINNFSNLVFTGEKKRCMVLEIDHTDEVDTKKVAQLKFYKKSPSHALLLFTKKYQEKPDPDNKIIFSNQTKQSKKAAQLEKILHNQIHLTAAAICVIASHGVYPVITIRTNVDKTLYIQNILSILPAGIPLILQKKPECKLSFVDKDFSVLARSVLAEGELIDYPTFKSIFQLIWNADTVSSPEEFVDVNLQNDIDQKGLLDDRIEEDNQIDYDPTQGDETGVLDPDQATSPENQNLIPEKYHKKLVEMAQDLKKRGLTVEPILKEFFKVVYTKEYRGKCNQEALDELIMDAQSAATNAADMTKEKLKTKQNDNKFTKTIPQKPNVINNLFSWGMYIGKYIVGLYGLTHIIFALRSKFKR